MNIPYRDNILKTHTPVLLGIIHLASQYRSTRACMNYNNHE